MNNDSYYRSLIKRVEFLEANKSISDTVDNARQAASFLKSLGFIKGKKVKGTSAHYYIGNDCGIILSSSVLIFPKKYNVTKNILDTDYTLVNTLPILGFALQKKGLQPSKTTIDETIAYTLLNNGRGVNIEFPASKDEIEENIFNAQKDGKKIRALINAYFDKISSKKESLIYNEEKENTGVIKKVDNKWRILKKDRKRYWNAEYDTKSDAEDALKAYWANKHECKNNYNHKFSICEAVDGDRKLYEDSDWTVYRITTPEAARRYGKRASWDIAESGRSVAQIFKDYIKLYNLDGGFYFYISKNDSREQYCVLQTKDRKIKAIWDVMGDLVDFLDVDLPVVPEVNLNGISDSDRLIKAISEGDAAAAKELLSSGADPNAVLRSGHSLICVAAGDLNYPMVKLLLKFGADPNMYDKVNGVTPIQAALHNMKWDTNKASSGKNAVIKELLSYGAEVNKETLKKLCSDGNVLIVKQIMSSSNNVKPDSSLLWAASEFMTKENLELVEFLLKSGANPNTPNSYGETLLQRALKWNQNNKLVAKYVDLLKQYGAK